MGHRQPTAEKQDGLFPRRWQPRVPELISTARARIHKLRTSHNSSYNRASSSTSIASGMTTIKLLLPENGCSGCVEGRDDSDLDLWTAWVIGLAVGEQSSEEQNGLAHER